MSSIVTAVFKATIGLLVNKGRDKAAEKLKDGDVTDQKIRDMIVREIDDIKSKLDGLARKDLLTSISYFRLGVVHLFELLDKTTSDKDGSVTAGTVMETDERSLAVRLRSPSTSGAAAVSIAEGLKNVKLTHLDDAGKRALSDAKEGFKVACLKATEAFNNEALSTFDRIQAMVIRVAATILEKVDHPEDAIAACRLCLEELHSMPAVQNSFAVEFKKSFWALFSQAERSEIICTVYRLNRVIYDVTLMVCFGNKGLSNWPCVDYGEGKVNPLRDPRVAETLRKLGMEHLWLPWSFGQEGDNRLKFPLRIAINSQGQFIIADIHRNIKVFDSSGKFRHSFGPRTSDNESTRESFISDIATDHNDNIYIATWNSGGYNHFYVYEKTADRLDTFSLRYRFHNSLSPPRLTISENNKVLILKTPLPEEKSIVDVYETDGQFVCSFGDEILKDPSDITAAEGCVMVADCSDTGNCVHIFNEEGDHLKEFKLEEGSQCKTLKIAFHQASGHVLVASKRKVLIYTKDGQFVRSVEHHAELDLDMLDIRGITVSEAGRIAVACRHHKVLFLQ